MVDRVNIIFDLLMILGAIFLSVHLPDFHILYLCLCFKPLILLT